MHPDIPFWLSLVLMLGGLAVLAWSSDVFVDGAAAVAKAIGVSPFVIGMVVIGFGTSAPELCVSTMSGLSGHANILLGNAYGSNIFNIAMILGIAVLLFPLAVRPAVSLVAGPGLAAISLLSLWILSDGRCSRGEACLLLGVFLAILLPYCWYDQKRNAGGSSAGEETGAPSVRIWKSLLKVAGGLGLLIGSSHLLVWGAVDLAKFCGVSDLVIGLTIVAAGTSFPELASAVASARRGAHEFVLGNIIGSNLFNTLVVVGMATVISPLAPGPSGEPAFSRHVLTRDIPLMTVLSLSILFFGVNWKHPGRPGAIRRKEAMIWIVTFVVYTLLMFYQGK